MKAARIYEPGKPFQIDEVAKPEMKPGHALVRVKAAGDKTYKAAARTVTFTIRVR